MAVAVETVIPAGTDNDAVVLHTVEGTHLIDSRETRYPKGAAAPHSASNTERDSEKCKIYAPITSFMYLYLGEKDPLIYSTSFHASECRSEQNFQPFPYVCICTYAC